MSHASYLSEIFNPEALQREVKLCAELIEDKFPDVDYIVGTGISGVVMASAISFYLDKHLFIIRKEIDDTHSRSFSQDTSFEGKPKSCEYLELNKENPTAVIIDDLIASGRTIARISTKLIIENIKCLGVILYHESAYNGKPFGKGEMNFPVYSTSDAID